MTINRTLSISNYRNLGVSVDGVRSPTSLKINRSIADGELGGLVLLMGMNNSGKSNVLDALECCQKGYVERSDEPDFMEPIIPKLEILISSRADSRTVVSVSKEKELEKFIDKAKKLADAVMKKVNTIISNNDDETEKDISIGREARREYEEPIYALAMEVLDDGELDVFGRHDPDIAILKEAAEVSGIQLSVGENGATDETQVTKLCHDCVISFAKELSSRSEDRQFLSDFDDYRSDFFASIAEIASGKECQEAKMLWKKIMRKADEVPSMDAEGLSNRVYRYKSGRLTRSDMTCRPDALSDFVRSVLTNRGIDEKTIRDAYAPYNSDARRERLEKLINEELEKDSDKFNDMFNGSKKLYSFRITLETRNILFRIKRGDIYLNYIERQSEGFRWMFDFYFNFLKRVAFKRGDMAVIDEFGCYLNPLALAEISDTLRDLGKKKGLTFIVATQNFMAVDTDRLDEIRLVVNQDGGNTVIMNEFDGFGDNHDVLQPLLDTLTISRNFLSKNGRLTVFVESGTQYLILTAFARRLGFESIGFMCIKGLGHSLSEMDSTAKELLSMERFPFVLIDDANGEKFQDFASSEYSGELDVHSVSELMSSEGMSFMDLFSKKDRATVDLSDFDECASLSQNFESRFDSFDDETKGNFAKLLSNIG